MHLITARVEVREEHWDEAVALAKSHVAASRREPGCLTHDWFVAPDAQRTLVFLERWKDRAAIEAHFAEPYSQQFAVKYKEWCAGDLAIEIHEVAATQVLSI